MNKAIAIISCLIAFATTNNLSAQAFKEKSLNYIETREFKKAEKLLDNLSEQEKKTHLYLVDSLRQTIYRIRKDFSLSPQEGKQKICDRMKGVTDEKKNK